MEFTRELSTPEYRQLTREEQLEYIDWLKEKNKEKEQLKKQNWTFDDWCKDEFTMNNFVAARRDFFLEEEKIDELVKKRLNKNESEQFTFFWETASPFSQWHKSKFVAPSYMWEGDFLNKLVEQEIVPKEREFTSAEQYMMYSKAMLFLDFDIAEKIMETNNVRKIKALGREVKRFEENTWYVFRWRFVMQGNQYKFTQNAELEEALFATQGTTLVEASPYDKIWGIGLTKDELKAQKRATWEGKNLLGEILTELRIKLMKKY